MPRRGGLCTVADMSNSGRPARRCPFRERRKGDRFGWPEVSGGRVGSGKALLLVVGLRELQVALGEFLDIDVPEGDDPDVLHEPRWAVHIPHPGVLHGVL